MKIEPPVIKLLGIFIVFVEDGNELVEMVADVAVRLDDVAHLQHEPQHDHQRKVAKS